MKDNRSSYKKSIAGLRQTSAPDIWQSIRTELDSQEEGNQGQLRQAVETLKDQQAPDVWLGVAKKLHVSKRRWPYWTVAACTTLAVLSFAYWMSLGVGTRSEELTYSTEEVEFFEVGFAPVVATAPDADDLLLDYIRQNCTRLIVTCQDPEFKALLEAYMELDQTKEQLNDQMRQAENTPRMMKYLIKVEKDQAEIGKDMLKKLKSI